MSDTPRTDVEVKLVGMFGEHLVGVGLCRTLERELNQRTAEVEMLRGVGCEADGDGPCGVCVKCLKRDALRYQAIRNLYDQSIRRAVVRHYSVFPPTERLDEAVDAAIAAQRSVS